MPGTLLVSWCHLIGLHNEDLIPLTALVTFLKSLTRGISTVLLLQGSSHLRTRFATPAWMQRRLKAEAVLSFVEIEVSSLAEVMLPFGATQANPPLFTSGINRLGPGARQFPTRILCDLVIVSKGDNYRSTSTQGVFVHVKFIVWQTIRHGLFHRITGCGSGRGSSRSQQRRADYSEREHRPDSRN